MSLIFSALAEIDKQAQDGRAAFIPMASASTPGYARRNVMLLIVLVLIVLALCLGGYALYKGGSTGQTTAALQSAAVAARTPDMHTTRLRSDGQAVAKAITSGISVPALVGMPQVAPVQAVQAAGPSDVGQLPPYVSSGKLVLQAARAVGSLPIRIVRRNPVPSALEVSAATDSQMAPARQKTSPKARRFSEETLAVSQQQVHVSAQPGTQQATVPAKPPAPAAVQDDAPYIGSNNYIKVGMQPDVAVDRDIGHWVDAFRSAMANGEHQKAKTALARLRAGLSPQSLTLLRMQAWYAVDAGNDDTARTAYVHLLQRLPDDVNAGVNVALIDWRSGHRDAALQRINSMYTQDPGSALVKRNWQAMHQQR